MTFLTGFPWFVAPLFSLYLVAESGSRWLALGLAALGLCALGAGMRRAAR